MPDHERRPYIAGNWKMHKTVSETHRYVGEFLPRLNDIADGIDVSICVPFTDLGAAIAAMVSGPMEVAVTIPAHTDPLGISYGASPPDVVGAPPNGLPVVAFADFPLT